MNDQDKRALVRQAVDELANQSWPHPNPWLQISRLVQRQDNEWLDWWWRSINRIDIPTWRTLRAKVVEIRLRK